MRHSIFALALIVACGRSDRPQEGGTPSASGGGSAAASSTPSRDTSAAADSALLAALVDRLPDLEFSYLRRLDAPPSGGRLISVNYQTPGKSWPFGVVLAFADSGDAITWDYRVDGDYSPHTVSWLDANGDGQADLFFLNGEEDYFATTLFVRAPRGSTPAFVRAFRDSIQYRTVLDLDHDGRPEFLGGAFLVDSTAMGDDSPCDGVQRPEWVADSAQRRYRAAELSGFSGNFTYGFVGAYSFMMHWREPLQILRIEGTRPVDVTREFPDEVRWRLLAVDEMLAAAPPSACRRQLERVATHLRQQLSR